MASNKLQRTNEDIRFALSRLLPQVKDPRVQQGELMSITHVDTTGDLRYCKVSVSFLGEVNEKEFKKGIKSASPWLRRELGAALSLRYTPELLFVRDQNIAYGVHVAAVLRDIASKTEESDQNQDE